MVKIGLIGCGMWGRNLARNLKEFGVLETVADRSIGQADDFASEFHCKKDSVDGLIADENLDGIVISTSAPSHDEIAISSLKANKHIYVEKPLSLTYEGAKAIASAAKTAGKQVMVGHLIRYHSAFLELQRQISNGAIGQLRHIQANRLAMGLIRNTESVLFDLCPHDLSLILALTDQIPNKVFCSGASHMTPGLVDFLSCSLGFDHGVSAGIQTSWLCPYKEHRLTITGDDGALVFDDTKPWSKKLTLYKDIMTLNGEHFIIDRSKPVNINVVETEPLKDEMRIFIETCKTNSPAPTDIIEALKVQSVLETMQKQLVDMTQK